MTARLYVPAGLELTEPDRSGNPWIVSVNGGVPSRLSPDLARVLQWFQQGQSGGSPQFSGEPLDRENLEVATTMLENAGLLTRTPYHVSDNAKTTRKSRVHFNSLFSIQIDILNQPGHFAWLQHFAKRGFLLWAAALNVLLGLLGIFLVLVNREAFFTAMSTPQEPLTLLALYMCMMVGISIHELAHGATLMYFGGKVRRIGVMLFYLSPAFFCDVTDAWKLPHNWQRTMVALAGVVTTFGISGLSCLIFVLTGGECAFLALLTIAFYVASMLNLAPFIKLDGYIALMTFLDQPNLRDKTMREWKTALVYFVTGSWGKLRRLSLLRVVFGLACSGTPLAMLLLMAYRQDNDNTGIIGQVIGAALVWGALFLMLRGIIQIAKETRQEHKPIWSRFIVVGTTALVLIPLGFAPVPLRQMGAYWTEGDSTYTNLVAPRFTGKTVELKRAGLLATETVGVGRISKKKTQSAQPMQALSPTIKVSGVLPPQPAKLLENIETIGGNTVGLLVAEMGEIPLGTWIMQTATLDWLQSNQ
ncbi:zinc metalloprotease [Mobiluncus mulieris]|uniref:zinc metalloprotease n=1 Tax=Mobiluncus mulieris TaxID=2052 RepID=UPI0021E2C642|nr:zinc metalloprotease [Mobiluncus mulieris]